MQENKSIITEVKINIYKNKILIAKKKMILSMHAYTHNSRQLSNLKGYTL